MSDSWKSGTALCRLCREFGKPQDLARNDPRNYAMIVIALILLYLAIKKEFEPLLLLPIAFGMLLVNLVSRYYGSAHGRKQTAACSIISTRA